MAEVKVNKTSSEEQKGGQMERRQERGMARRGEFFPSIFNLGPGELFGMSPFALMRRFTEEMDRAFAGGRREQELWAPPVEIRERGGNLIVCADLPGMNKDDVKVEVTDDGLVIQGHRHREEEEKREGFYRSERSYGEFHRLIPLPDEAKVDQARAQFNNGVLEISIPIPQAERKRREIPVEAGGEKVKTSGGGGA